ncbi:MAG: hypothetical protein ACPHEP_11725 [Acidimicrobiales bacterium]
MRSLRRQISDREKLPKIGTMGSLGQTVQGGRLQSPSLSLRQPLPSVDPRNFTPVPDSAVKAMQKRLPSRGPVNQIPIDDFIAQEAAAQGVAPKKMGFLKAAGKRLLSAMTPKAPDQLVDSFDRSPLGRATAGLIPNALKQRASRIPQTPGQLRSQTEAIYNSPDNVVARQDLLARQQAVQGKVDRIQDSYQKMADKQLYDASAPKNMAMAVAPRENVKIDEGMVAESAQRARERLAGATQPGGMVSTDALNSMANREAQARLAPQRALAQREDVHPLDEKAFTRRVDRNPDSPTYGKAFVSGLYPQVGDTLNSAEARREARQSGGVFESPDGAITDYGKLNARNQRRADERQASRELRTRTAQLQGVDPSLSRAGAAGIASGQLRAEKLMQEEMTRKRMLEDADLKIKQDQAAAQLAREQRAGTLEQNEANLMQREYKLKLGPMGGQLMYPGMDGVTPQTRYEGLRQLATGINEETGKPYTPEQKRWYLQNQFGITDVQQIRDASEAAGFNADGMDLGDFFTGNWFQWDETDQVRDMTRQGLSQGMPDSNPPKRPKNKPQVPPA